MGKCKLTEKEKHMIVAEYSTGSFSMRELGEKYHVSTSGIRNVLTTMPEVAKICEEEKKAQRQSMRQWLASRSEKAQCLLDVILELDPGELRAANLRDKMGALKILKEAFLDADPNAEGGGKEFHSGTFVVLPPASTGENKEGEGKADADNGKPGSN